MTEFEQKEVEDMNLKQGTMNIFIAAMQTDRNMLTRTDEQLEDICQKCQMIAERLLGNTNVFVKEQPAPIPEPSKVKETINIQPASQQTSVNWQVLEMSIMASEQTIPNLTDIEEVDANYKNIAHIAETFRTANAQEFKPRAQEIRQRLQALSALRNKRKEELSQVSAA